MSRLNGIIKGFNKLISKLEALEDDNQSQVSQLSHEIKEKNNLMGELSAEAKKARGIRDKIVELIA